MAKKTLMKTTKIYNPAPVELTPEEIEKKRKEYYKQWTENNKDKIKRICVCDICGASVQKYYIHKHKMSMKCKYTQMCNEKIEADKKE